MLAVLGVVAEPWGRGVPRRNRWQRRRRFWGRVATTSRGSLSTSCARWVEKLQQPAVTDPEQILKTKMQLVLCSK